MNAAKIFVHGLIACSAAVAGAREVSVAPTDDFEKVLARVQKTRNAGESVEIVFEDGIHALSKCITLTSADSGLVFRARNPWKAVLVGGIALTLGDFKPLTASTAPKGLPAVAKEKVRAWDVPQDLRRALGRLWDGEPVLLANLAVRPMARWPNGGYVTIPKSGAGAEKRHLMVFDKRMNGWCGGIVSRLKAKKGSSADDALGLDASDEEETLLEEKRPDSELPGNALGFFGMTGAYASGGARGYFTSELGMPTIRLPERPEAGRQVYFFGMVEELDEPGEWCYDRIGHRLLLWPDEGMSKESSIVVATRADGFVRFGRASDVAIEGLTFAALARGALVP